MYPKRINNPTYTETNGTVRNGYGPVDDTELWKSKNGLGAKIESTLRGFGYSVTTMLDKNQGRPDDVRKLIKSYKCVLKG